MYDPSLTPAEQERFEREDPPAANRARGRTSPPRRPPVPTTRSAGLDRGVIALTVIVLYLGILALSPAIMAWVEARPTLIQNDLVVDFVNWYDPAAIDTPASSTYQRISVEIPPGATDSFIGDLLVGQGLIHSELAFHYQVYQAEREGTSTPASTTCHPRSCLVHHRRTPPGGGARGHDHHSRGLRLEELIAYLGTTELTMDLDEFRTLVVTPPPDVISAYPFLAELPAGRNLEGYLYPDTYRLFANATARDVLDRLLSTFDQRVTQDIRDQLAARGLNIEWAIRLASIVEREAVLDEERALIAGVYTRRPRPRAGGWTPIRPSNGDCRPPSTAACRRRNGERSAGGGRCPPGAPRSCSHRSCRPTRPTRSSACHPRPSPHRGSPRSRPAFPDMEAGYFFFVAACPNGVRRFPPVRRHPGRPRGEHRPGGGGMPLTDLQADRLAAERPTRRPRSASCWAR